MLKGLYQQLLLLHLYDHSTATHQLTKHFGYEHTQVKCKSVGVGLLALFID